MYSPSHRQWYYLYLAPPPPSCPYPERSISNQVEQPIDSSSHWKRKWQPQVVDIMKIDDPERYQNIVDVCKLALNHYKDSHPESLRAWRSHLPGLLQVQAMTLHLRPKMWRMVNLQYSKSWLSNHCELLQPAAAGIGCVVFSLLDLGIEIPYPPPLPLSWISIPSYLGRKS